MTKRVAVLGDVTTTGGRIISASGEGFNGFQGIALLGDYASCPSCKSTGKIIEGTQNFMIGGKPAAYDGCIIACGCTIGSHRIIALQSSIFVNVQSVLNQPTPPQNKSTPQDFITKQDTSKIRLDAQRLLDCAQQVCEKHLYYSEIKQGFMDDIDSFASDIVNKVETGSMSYEQGAKQIKEEEQSLWEQSYTWVMNGLSIFGGIGMVMAGVALCETVVGCFIGAPLMAHGANGIYEGAAGMANGALNLWDGGNRNMNVDGPLRQAYQGSAQALGFNAYVGNLAYDLVDIGSSIHGKLKLLPKLNEFGNPRLILFVKGRADVERAYKQMSDTLLSFEVGSDVLSLWNIKNDIKNAFVLDKETNQVSMIVSEPETITNVGEIVDNCSLVITITGKTGDEPPTYYHCERADGSKYTKDNDGNITEGGLH